MNSNKLTNILLIIIVVLLLGLLGMANQIVEYEESTYSYVSSLYTRLADISDIKKDVSNIESRMWYK